MSDLRASFSACYLVAGAGKEIAWILAIFPIETRAIDSKVLARKCLGRVYFSLLLFAKVAELADALP